jgi:hypothetical protein
MYSIGLTKCKENSLTKSKPRGRFYTSLLTINEILNTRRNNGGERKKKGRGWLR